MSKIYLTKKIKIAILKSAIEKVIEKEKWSNYPLTNGSCGVVMEAASDILGHDVIYGDCNSDGDYELYCRIEDWWIGCKPTKKHLPEWLDHPDFKGSTWWFSGSCHEERKRIMSQMIKIYSKRK